MTAHQEAWDACTPALVELSKRVNAEIDEYLHAMDASSYVTARCTGSGAVHHQCSTQWRFFTTDKVRVKSEALNEEREPYRHGNYCRRLTGDDLRMLVEAVPEVSGIVLFVHGGPPAHARHLFPRGKSGVVFDGAMYGRMLVLPRWMHTLLLAFQMADMPVSPPRRVSRKGMLRVLLSDAIALDALGTVSSTLGVHDANTWVDHVERSKGTLREVNTLVRCAYEMIGGAEAPPDIKLLLHTAWE